MDIYYFFKKLFFWTFQKLLNTRTLPIRIRTQPTVKRPYYSLSRLLSFKISNP